MPKYEVLIRRDLRREGIIEVEAESADEAFLWTETMLVQNDVVEWIDDYTDDFIEVNDLPPHSTTPLISGWARDANELL